MRTITLFGSFPPPYGGVATHMLGLYSNLKKKKLRVKVLGSGDFEPAKDVRKFTWSLDKVIYHTGRSSVLRDENMSYFEDSVISSIPVKTLFHDHSHLLPYPQSANIYIQKLKKVLQVKKAKWICTIHDGTLINRYADMTGDTKRFFSDIVNCLDFVICTNDKLEHLILETGIAKDKVAVVNPLLPFSYSEGESLPSLIVEFFEKHPPIFSTTGLFTPLHDFKTIVESFIKIKEKFHDAGLVIIDAAYARDDAYKKEILEKINKHSASVFILEKLSANQILDIFRKSSVFIRGVEQESFGLSKIEAIHMGTPVITTETGETRYMTTYKFGDPSDLCEKIESVLKNPPRLDEAKAFYIAMAEKNIEQIINIYKQL